VNLNYEDIKSIVTIVLEELGEKASPTLVKSALQKTLEKMEHREKKENIDSGRAILTAFGVNKPGVLAKITTALSNHNIDIEDVSQKIMQEFFTLIMVINITNSPKDLTEIQNVMNNTAQELGIKIYIQHEDTFKYMHRI